MTLETQVREAAISLGFAAMGIASAEPFVRGDGALQHWLAAGFAGDMAYMSRNAAVRADPRALLPEARSLVVVALALPDTPPLSLTQPIAVARYALGADYHRLMRQRLEALAGTVATCAGITVRSRVCVDTAPILEREAAARAGLAFIGKSTLAIVPKLGSHFLLGVLLTDLELLVDSPREPRCGRCVACLDACPTRALVAPFQLDSRRCISYLTIEYRGIIPHALRSLVGHRVVGCDACQNACPFNATRHRPTTVADLAPRSTFVSPDLSAWLQLSTGDYRRLVRGTALSRVGRQQLARNAAVALGNSGDFGAIEPLAHALESHPSSLVRQHVAWALGRLDGRDALSAAARHDPDPAVRKEALEALAGQPDS